jgi:hypothetical protein
MSHRTPQELPNNDDGAGSTPPVRMRREKKRGTTKVKKTPRKRPNAPSGIHRRANKRTTW